MRHRRAIELLPDLGSGVLAATTESELIAHAERCSACRSWIATHELLASGMPQDRASRSHPGSEVLALCVVRPEEINEPDREEVRSHLESCPICQEHVRILRAAVLDARPRVMNSSTPRWSNPPTRIRMTRPLAAALVSVLLLGSLLFAGLMRTRLLTGDGDPPSKVASISAARVVQLEELTQQTLDGERLIRSDHRLMVSDVKVNKGASVTFHAEELVAFGDGFRVEAGARMTAGSGPARARAPRSRPPARGGAVPSRKALDTKPAVQ